ncbi:MAG TPA: hypothetical protein PK912_04085, partial [Microthrixaceae bacterium]|nr:hypothetical protein [Microthrixaceae bacterium]
MVVVDEVVVLVVVGFCVVGAAVVVGRTVVVGRVVVGVDVDVLDEVVDVVVVEPESSPRSTANATRAT